MTKRISKKIYNCVKLESKKYKERKSPPYHARDCPNKIKTGNDGKLWISLSSITGIFSWKPYSKELIQKKENKIKELTILSKERKKKLLEIRKKGTKKRTRSKSKK
jgi:hypothetical protein